MSKDWVAIEDQSDPVVAMLLHLLTPAKSISVRNVDAASSRDEIRLLVTRVGKVGGVHSPVLIVFHRVSHLRHLLPTSRTLAELVDSIVGSSDHMIDINLTAIAEHDAMTRG